MATTPASSSSATTGALQSLGLGSGLDIKSLVSSLVTAELTPDVNRLTRQTSAVATKLSAMGQLKGALATFQSSLDSLSTADSFQTHAVTSGDETIFTASATSVAAPGNYQVEVVNLAQAQQLASTPIAGNGSANVGTGTLTLKLGSSSFSVKIDADHASLNAIRDAINSASGNPGISATIVHGNDNTSKLVLNSVKTGVANQIQVTAADGDGGLNSLVYDASHTTSFTPLQDAKDATIKVAGVTYNSATNAVTGAIDGVTINLLKDKAGTSISLKVANDLTSVSSRVQSFVNAYNNLRTVIGKLGSYDAATNTAGPLLGNALLENISTQTRRLATGVVASASPQYNSLATIGVTTNRDGTLTLDSTKLTAALNTNFSAISTLFSNSDGVGAQLSSYVKAQLASNSSLVASNKTLTDQQAAITKQQATLTSRQALLTTRYTAQFTAMDSALAQMQQTSSYLTQQFTILSKIASGSTG